MAEIDSLEIQIEADARRASSAIDALIDKLGKLDSALNLKNIGNISKAFAGMSETMKDTSGIDRLNAGMSEFSKKSQGAMQTVKKNMDSVQRKAADTSAQIKRIINESTASTKEQKAAGERFYLGNKDGVKGIDVMAAELLKLKEIFKGMTESDIRKAVGGEGLDYSGAYNEVINKIKEIIYEFGRLDVAGDQTAKDIIAAMKSISGIDMTGLKEEGHDMAVIRQNIAEVNKSAHNIVMTLKKSNATTAIFEDLHGALSEVDSDFANIANRADFLDLLVEKIRRAKDQTIDFNTAVNEKKQSLKDVGNFLMEVSTELSKMGQEEAKSTNGFYKIAAAINQMAGKAAPKISEVKAIYSQFMDEIAQKAFKLDTTQKETSTGYDYAKQSLSVISASWDDVTEKARRYADAINYIKERFEELIRGMNIGLPDKGIFSADEQEQASPMVIPRQNTVDGEIISELNVYEEEVDRVAESENNAAEANFSLVASFAVLGHELEKVSQLFNKLSGKFTSMLKVMYIPLKAVVEEYKEKLQRIGGFFDKFKKKVQANLAKMSAFWKRAMKTFTFMLVRKAITAVIGSINDATKSLALFSKEVGTAFNDNISSAIADFKWIAKSIVGAFEPIINYVVPILDRLAAALVKVNTLLGHFFAAMTGQGYYMVAKKKVDDFAGSIDKAAKAAKRAVRPFDELNLITTPSSGGEEDATNPYDDWDMKPVTDKMKDFADKVKDILEGLWEPMAKAWDRTSDYVLSGFKYMVEELKKLAADIGRDFMKVWKQEATVKMFENLLKIVGDLERVIGNLAKRFREAWNEGKNGFFIFENLRDIAATLVQHIRNVTRYMIDWSDSIDFKPLLKSIEELTRSLVKVADFIGSVFYDVMVNVILKYIKWMAEEGLPHMLETLKEVINAFDFEHIRRGLLIVEQAFEDMFENVHTGVTDALGQLGLKIAEWTNSEEFTRFMQAIAHIMEQFTSDRVEKVLEGLGLAILHIAESLAKFVSSDTFLDFVDKIGEWIDNHSAEDIAKIAEKIAVLAAAFKVLGSVAGSLAGVIQTIAMFQAFGNIAKIASGFGKPTKEVAAFSNVLSGLAKTFPATAGLFEKMGAGLAKITSPLAGLGAKLQSGASGIKAAATATGSTFAETFFYATITAIAGYNIGKKIGETITGDIELYKNFKLFDFKELFTGDPLADMKDMFDGLVEMMTDFENNPVIAGLANIVAGPLMSIGVGIKSFIDSNPFGGLTEKFGEVKDSAHEKMGGLKEWFSSLWEDISGGASLMWQDITAGISDIWEKIKAPFEPIISFFEGFALRVGQIFEGIWIVIKAVWITVTEWIDTNVIQPIKEFFEGLWADIKAVWDSVTEWFDTYIIQPLVQFFSQLIEDIKQFFADLWADIKSIWSAVSEWFDTNVIQPVAGFFRQLWEDVKGFFADLWADIQSIWNKVTSWFDTYIISPLKKAFSTAIAFIKSLFTALWTAIKSGVKSSFNFVIGIVEKAVNGIINGINGFFKLFNAVVDFAAKITGEDWKGVELIPNITLPRFATGGFPEDGLFRASHGEIMGKFDNGQSVVANNQQIIDGIKGGVVEGMIEILPALAQAMSNSGTTVEIQADTAKLFKAVVKENSGANKRTFGNSPIYSGA